MDWETLKADCLACSRCELCKTRTNVVFGQGVPDAEVLFVGEGPGQSEDEQGPVSYTHLGCFRGPFLSPS